MAEVLPLPVDRLPTLTEVLDLGRDPGASPSDRAVPLVVLPVLADSVELPMPEPMAAPLSPPLPVPMPVPAPAARLDEDAVVERVLAALQPRIDEMLEARVSEALAPAMARAADLLIRDSRLELQGALRQLVQESLAQVLRQHGFSDEAEP